MAHDEDEFPPSNNAHGDKAKGTKSKDKDYPMPEQRMEPHGNYKGPKHTNHREHDHYLQKSMPEGYKGGKTDSDCEEE
jgi:hypothetical protein